MTTRHLFMTIVRSSAAAMVVLLTFAACDRQQVVAPEQTISEQRAHAGPASISNAQVVEVIARHDDDGIDYVFDLSDDVIPAGWTTFELDNHSSSTHFVFLARVPDGAVRGAAEAGDDVELLDYWIESVTHPFQAVMDDIIASEDNPFVHFGEIPGWFGDVVPMGGPGFTQGHLSSRTTVYLEPGHYVLECYVKDAEGKFHSYTGMISLLEVDGDMPSRTSEPRATFDVVVSSGNGIEAAEEMRPGLHSIRVHFADQNAYGHGLGHDLHLIRLNGTDVEDVARWMNWMAPTGLESSSRDRGPQTFIGGVQTMKAGSVGYMTVKLTPGDYAWISEVPHPDEDPTNATPMWQTFTVPFGTAAGGP